MARSGRRGFPVVFVTALALLATPLPALALFAVHITGPGGYDQTVNDNEVSGKDLNPAVNGITLFAGLGGLPIIPGFSLSLDTVQTNTPGGPSSSFVDLIWTLSSVGGVGGAVVITASATDFTYPASGSAHLVSAVTNTSFIAGSSPSGATAQQWVNLANTLFGMGVITPGLQSAIVNNTASIGFNVATPYSITDQLNLTLGPNGQTSGDLNSTVVPEPITMFLGGTGLLVLAYAGRRRLFGR